VRPHIPKVDTGDDYEFMCGTHAFGATVATRDVCQSCVKRSLEIVDLLAQAYDELNVPVLLPSKRKTLLKRIDKALGNRARVNYSRTP
jgi:hypothetical protein